MTDVIDLEFTAFETLPLEIQRQLMHDAPKCQECEAKDARIAELERQNAIMREALMWIYDNTDDCYVWRKAADTVTALEAAPAAEATK